MQAPLVLALGLAMTLAAAGAPAAPTRIGFDELATPFGSFLGAVESAGYRFENTAPGGSTKFIVWGSDNPWDADPGGATLSQAIAGTTTTLSRTGGGPFSLLAGDFGNVYNAPGNPQDLGFVATLAAGGTVGATVHTNGLAGLTHIDFGSLFRDIVEVAWTPANGAQNNFLQFDNLLVVVAAMPEPASGLLLALGLAGLGLARRHRSGRRRASPGRAIAP